MTMQARRRWLRGTIDDPGNGATIAIVTISRLIAVGALAAAAAGCSGPPVEVRGRFEVANVPAVDVRVVAQGEHRRDAPRYLRGAVSCLATVQPWLGSSPDASVTIVDPPWHASTAADSSVVTLPETRWWSLRTAMAPELAAARAIARRRWTTALDVKALPSWFTAGLIEYTARRAVIPLFQGDNLPPGYAMLEQRYFDAFVPWFVRIRLLPEADGDPMPAYRANPRADAAAPPTLESERSLTAKTVLTLNTLERWVSQPAFDSVLAEFVRAFRAGRPTIGDFTRVASATTGQDLSWLLDQTLGASVVFDYAVSDLTSGPNAAGGFDTIVVVERLGDGVFTGSSAPRVGPFESGRGVSVAVTFESGERAVNAWDGRETRKTFAYRSASRASAVVLDPERIILLDTHRTNNSRGIAPQNAAEASRWAARWMLWLESVLLTYGVFV
jgi:hypothetical protein